MGKRVKGKGISAMEGLKKHCEGEAEIVESEHGYVFHMKEKEIEQSRGLSDGMKASDVIFDYDKEGNIIGVEILK